MKFRTYDTKENKHCITEIKRANLDVIDTFVQTWVPSYTSKRRRDRALSYSLFRWNQYVKFSTLVDSSYQCHAAYTGSRLDGLICIKVDEVVKIAFLSTAPWNYGKNGRMRRIGSGLLALTIMTSIFAGRGGEFITYAVPDAEPFYQKAGMIATGEINDDDLNEYIMTKKAAQSFLRKVEKYLIRNKKPRDRLSLDAVA